MGTPRSAAATHLRRERLESREVDEKDMWN